MCFFNIDTTDVQMIRAIPLKDTNAFMLQCTFIIGSNAQGCMVVLVSGFENITGNITGNLTGASGCNSGFINVTHPPSNYSEVFGFDIESDGSVGSLAIPGVLVMNASTTDPCMPGGVKHSPSEFTNECQYSRSM